MAASFDAVAYIHLAALLARTIAILVAAVVALRTKNAKLAAWSTVIRRELLHRSMLLLQGKLIGGISGPIQPFAIGLLLGPASVGIYDAMVRLSRVSKIVVGLLTSALLPVASRLDERGNSTTFQWLGELGLVVLPMFTVPPLAAAAVLSRNIMQVWIGPQLVPYAFWMGLSFLIPICTQYVAIGNILFLTRTKIQFRLNLLMGAQLLIWLVVSGATLGLFAERAFILGQVVGNLAVLPWQIETMREALKLDRRGLWKAVITQAIILPIASILLWLSADYIQIDNVLRLALLAAVFCVVTWVAQYFLVLESKHRAAFLQVGHLVGLVPKSS
jgi:O-antigen/teichoic acid export membrane protein